jgi:hypothetical protein
MSRLALTNSNAIIASPAAAAETIVATCGPLSLIVDTAQVLLLWFVEFTVGTSGTSAKALLRRGATVSATQINVGALTTVVAGNLVRFSGFYIDSPASGANLQYSLSLTIGAGAATSTVSDVQIIATVL